MKLVVSCQIVFVFLVSSCTGVLNETGKTSVRVENNAVKKSVDIYFGDDLFTSYIYPDNINAVYNGCDCCRCYRSL